MAMATLNKKNVNWSWLFLVVGSMAVHRQAWCWRGSREFYVWIFRQLEERVTLGLA